MCIRDRIRAIRSRTQMSQAVFAAVLNTSVSTAVSYTHLDVYKRQAFCSSAMVLSDGAAGMALTTETRSRVLASRMKDLQIRRNMVRPRDDRRSRLLWGISNTRFSLQGIRADSFTPNHALGPMTGLRPLLTTPNRTVANGRYRAAQSGNSWELDPETVVA